MKRLLVTLLLLLVWYVDGKASRSDTLYLTRDSLDYYRRVNHKWLFHPGDDTAMAQPGYDDSKWASVLPGLNASLYPEYQKDSIGWFRLHFKIDSTLAGKAIAISLTQYGASETYLDGKKVAVDGNVKSIDTLEYFDPSNVPFIIVADTAGPHLLAIRYRKNMTDRYRHMFSDMDGFRFSFARPSGAIHGSVSQAESITFIFIFLFGIFMALSLVHMMLYLYYRAARSNLFFSSFCFSMSLVFLLPWLIRIAHTPKIEFNAKVALLFATSLTCFSLSGFINELFGKKKTRFFIITAICIMMPFTWFVSGPLPGIIILFSLIGLVAVEAAVLIIRAMIRRVKGARIIGTGMLLFALFILSLFVIALTMQEVDIDESTVFGQILELFMAVAILSMPFSMSAYLAWSFARVNKDLKLQLDQVQILSEKTLEQEQEKKRILESQKEELEKEVKLRTAEVVEQHEALKAEKKKSDDLLLNILPGEVAEELKEKGSSEAKYFDQVSVLFTDFVAFTKAGERMTPQELVSELDTCFKAFDDIISRHNIEKIKTIGDAYLAVCGLPVADAKHAENAVSAAQDILQFMKTRKQAVGDKTFEIRIGIHSGSVVAGIVGVKKFAYDIWGDTVNTAARMEQNSETGKINISQTTYELVRDQFECSYRGQISAKNKGELNMYFVEKEINRQ